ncbi:MAG: FHA domain-containing protein [Myxococcaceae bacterium]|nr:FHA domain-containing protein [Myxococcaceae bacterium]
MLLQVKDLASQKLITVPEEGLTFGREGGDAQVQVADMGVSKRHAEIFCEGGAWFLKDLGSSNGTLLANERIGDATEILPGDVFQLSKRKFEVLKVVEDDGGDEPQEEEEDAPPMTEPERKAPAKPAAKPAAKAAPPPAKKPAGQKMSSAGAGKSEPTRAAPEGGGAGDDEEMGNASVGQVLAGVPKAIGYYLVNVPLLLLNPFGTIRKAIEEQPRDPMGRMELIAWALPGNIFSGAMGFIAGLIAQIILGALSIGSLITGLIVGAIVAVVASVITGFIWHPLLTWVIAKLFKGESDARGRTNYFLQTQTAVIIAVLPSGLTTIIGALSGRFGIPFIMLVPVLLSAVAGALSLFVAYKWMEHFNVAKWVKIVLLVLMALTALGALAGIPAALSARGGGVAIGSGAGSSSSGDSDLEIPDDLDENSKAALTAAKNAIEQSRAAGAPAEAIKAAEDGFRQSLEAAKKAQEQIKAATAATGDVVKKAGDDVKKAGDDVKKAGDDVKKAADDTKKAADDVKKAADDTKKPPPPEEPKEPVKAAEPKDEPKGTPAVAVPSGSGYPSWRVKYDNIEKRITDDPTLLRKAPILKAYQELQEYSSEADGKVRKDYKKVDPKTFGHLRDAELYETSGKTVDELHKLLFGK